MSLFAQQTHLNFEHWLEELTHEASALCILDLTWLEFFYDAELLVLVVADSSLPPSIIFYCSLEAVQHEITKTSLLGTFSSLLLQQRNILLICLNSDLKLWRFIGRTKCYYKKTMLVLMSHYFKVSALLLNCAMIMLMLYQWNTWRNI